MLFQNVSVKNILLNLFLYYSFILLNCFLSFKDSQIRFSPVKIPNLKGPSSIPNELRKPTGWCERCVLPVCCRVTWAPGMLTSAWMWLGNMLPWALNAILAAVLCNHIMTCVEERRIKVTVIMICSGYPRKCT